MALAALLSAPAANFATTTATMPKASVVTMPKEPRFAANALKFKARRQGGAPEVSGSDRPAVKPPQVRQRLEGVVTAILPNRTAVLDVGLDRPALLSENNAKYAGPLHVGRQVEVWVKEVKETGPLRVTSFTPKIRTSSLRVGWKLNGTVHHFANGMDGVFVDVGLNKCGLLLASDMSDEWVDTAASVVSLDQRVQVWVKDVRPNGDFILTMVRPRLALDRLRVGQRMQGIVKDVMDLNGGGAFVDVGAARDGWLPNRELVGLTELAAGQRVEVWVKDVRTSTFQLTMQKPRRRIEELKVGQRMRGNVTGIADFGAFVDVGAVRDGLVHAGDDGPAGATLRVGQRVEVWVKAVRGEDVLKLTMVQPRVPVRRLRPGDAIRGTVHRVHEPYGVFVDIGTVGDALIEPGDYSEAAALQPGQELDLWVKKTWKDGKVFLTMFQPPEEEAPDEAEPASGRRPATRGIV